MQHAAPAYAEVVARHVHQLQLLGLCLDSRSH
jgi:hypothetical protein